MQVPPTDSARPSVVPTTAALVKVVAGDLSALPIGQVVQVLVAQVKAGEAILNVNGQPVTVRPAGTLQPGSILLARVPAGSAPALELLGRAPPTPTTTSPIVSPEAGRLAVVDVLSALPDGRMRVRLDGHEEVTASATGLAPGGRHVLQVERTPTGLTLRPPPDTPNLTTQVAGAVLRVARPPDLGALMGELLAELSRADGIAAPRERCADPATLGDMNRAGPALRSRVAANQVVETLQGLASSDHPASAGQLRSLVADGGLHFEAKLARTATGEDLRPIHAAVGTDLKGGLLRLLQAAHELGSAAALPAVRAAADGIEAQQAANALAQERGTPFLLQVPFPENGRWKTLHLAVEPDGQPEEADVKRSAGFRMLLHVPLNELGETWIDAGLTGDHFRAVLYLENPTARERVRAELAGLKTELRADGFAEVLLDVRPAADLPGPRRTLAGSMSAGRPADVSLLDVRA